MTPTNNAFVLSGRAKALEGMSMIRPFDLEVGQVIYRFYDSNRASTPEAGAQGAWWLEYEYFQKIRHFALQHGYTVSYAARLFAAILHEWSEVNAFVSCVVTKPIQVWKGRGKQVRSTGKDDRDTGTMTPMQGGLEIYQLAIPGLGDPRSHLPSVLSVKSSGAL
jgi:hypothetical protein